MERFISRKEKSHSSILMFGVEIPKYSMRPWPAPAKRQVQAKQGPGRPRRKPRQEDWNQQWINVVERVL